MKPSICRAVDSISSTYGASPVTDPMLTIQPAPCLRICGTAALVSTNGVLLKSRIDALVAVVSHVPHLTAATLMTLADARAEDHAALLRLAQHDADGAEATAREVREQGVRAVVRQLDLTDLPTAASAVDDLAAELGGVDVLVNCAGTGSAQKAVDMDFDTWRGVLSVDLDGAFCCLQAAARHMVSAGAGGRIVATGTPEQIGRVTQAFLKMKKFDLATLRKAAAGTE